MKTIPNLLIVDDARINLKLLETITQKIKVNLIQALSGREALEKVRGMELALAILDVQMPEMNGFELAMKLNEGRSGNKVPVIFITAHFVNEFQVFEGYDSGAVDYIFKPVDPHILQCKINVFLDLYNGKQKITRDAALLKKSAGKLTRINTALKKSEEKYRSYIDNAPDGVFVTDKTGKLIEVNEAVCKITGYSSGELLNRAITELLPEISFATGTHNFRNNEETQIAKADLAFTHKNGTTRWWAVETVRLDETHLLWFTKDITDRKKAEDESKNSLDQLHQLTKYIEKVRENERIAISRDLHDDLGQALTAVKIDLGMIRKSISDPKAVSKLDKVSAMVKETILSVQRLTSQLRPQIIDDLGLEAAIDWYTNDFTRRNSVKIFRDIDPDLSISSEASLTVFRIMQESLTNISRHSKADRVDIGLLKTGDNIYFTISDNGIGINEQKINSKNSFGIIGMRERVASFGGTFEIKRGIEKGTTIKIIFPSTNISYYEDTNL